MSVNDTNEWASAIINELFEEANAYEKISKCTSKDGKEAIDKNKSSGELHKDNGMSRYSSENYNNNQSDLQNSYGEKIEELSLTSNTNSRIFYDFNKLSCGRTSNNDQDVFTNTNTINEEMKINVRLLKLTNRNEVERDSSDQMTEEEIKNGYISEFSTENSKEEEFATDLNTTFIQDNKKESSMADAPKNIQELRNENINSKDISENLDEIPETLEAFSFDELCYKDQQKTNECILTIAGDMHKDFSEKPFLDNDKTDFSGQFGVKNECKNDKIASVGVNLGIISESLQEYPYKIGENTNHILFRNLQKDKNTEIDRDSKRINSHLYHQNVEENYAKDEIKTCWESIDGVSSSKYLAASNFGTFNVGEDLNENVNNILNGDKARRNRHLKDEADENITNSQKNGYMYSKGRRNMFLEVNPKNTNEKFMERNHKVLDDTSVEKISGIKRYSDILDSNKICMNNKNRNPMKSIFTNCKSSFSREELEEIAEDIDVVDDGELQIRDERAQQVISTYKDFCSLFEIFFVRRFAYVLADSYEFLSFFCFLVVCFLCFLYDRLQVLISIFRSMNAQKTLDSSCDETENMLLDDEESMTPSISIDTVFTGETILYNGDGKDNANLSDMRNEVIKQLKNINSWVKIEPSEVAVVSMEYEMENCIKNVYEKGENFLTYFEISKQYRATVKTINDCLVYFRFISNNENGKSELLFCEMDFDSEIVASSNRMHCGTDEDFVQQKTDTTCDSTGISDNYEGDSDLKAIIKKSPISFLSGIFPGNHYADEKPLFNSTEVDGLEIESISKQRSCPDFEVFSTSNMGFCKIEITPRNFMKKRFLNSSLDVNISSFSSRSDILIEIAPLLNELEGVPKNERKESGDDVKRSNGIEEDEFEELLSSNLEVSATENSENSEMVEAEKVLSEERNENSVEKYSDNENSRNLSQKSHMQRHDSTGFEVSDAADAHFENKDCLERSFMCGDTKFIQGFEEHKIECDLAIKNETVPNVKDNPKQKVNLRRRMSLILNNWRSIHVMPSCLERNLKTKKKRDEPKGK